MLKITRRSGESFFVGDPSGPDCVAVRIGRNDNGRIHIHIHAPRSVQILRSEVCEKYGVQVHPSLTQFMEKQQ